MCQLLRTKSVRMLRRLYTLHHRTRVCTYAQRSENLRTAQRKFEHFDGREESDSLGAHTQRIEAAVRSEEGQVCPLES